MKVLVTGGAGFIGSHIVERLVRTGYSVNVIDNFITGKQENLTSDVRLFRVDITHDKLDFIFHECTPQIVFHQAGQVSVRQSKNEPGFDALQNIMGTVRLIEACKKHEVEKIIYSSSGGAIYGNPLYYPVDESHPIQPISPYGISKYTAENYLRLLLNNSKTNNRKKQDTLPSAK